MVLCLGECKRRKLSTSGRKSYLGDLATKQNDDYLNPTSGALLVATSILGSVCNSDVQPPYKLPICELTHGNTKCKKKCLVQATNVKLAKAMQQSQNARIGYTTDYQCKRNCSSFHELREIEKGHRAINKKIRRETHTYKYLYARHVKRCISDNVAKSCVRSLQESTNLRAYQQPTDILGAEVIQTSGQCSFPAHKFLNLQQSIERGSEKHADSPAHRLKEEETFNTVMIDRRDRAR